MAKPGCENSLGSSRTQEEQVALSSWPLAEVHNLVMLIPLRQLWQIHPLSWVSILASVWTKVFMAKHAELRARSEYTWTHRRHFRKGQRERTHGPKQGGRKALGGSGRPL